MKAPGSEAGLASIRTVISLQLFTKEEAKEKRPWDQGYKWVRGNVGCGKDHSVFSFKTLTETAHTSHVNDRAVKTR